jgi:hypothetical protein
MTTNVGHVEVRDLYIEFSRQRESVLVVNGISFAALAA